MEAATHTYISKKQPNIASQNKMWYTRVKHHRAKNVYIEFSKIPNVYNAYTCRQCTRVHVRVPSEENHHSSRIEIVKCAEDVIVVAQPRSAAINSLWNSSTKLILCVLCALCCDQTEKNRHHIACWCCVDVDAVHGSVYICTSTH